jgi:hypothetical protein
MVKGSTIYCDGFQPGMARDREKKLFIDADFQVEMRRPEKQPQVLRLPSLCYGRSG